jgi:hypothetical protein
MKQIAMAVIIAAISAICARGQSFQNLDFESAYGLPGNPGSGELVSAANALPDWTAYYGPPSNDEPLSSITYASNSAPLGAVTVVSLLGGSAALSGEFGIELSDYASISQMGLVPENVGSLQFEALGVSSAEFSLTLGGQNLSYSEISEGSGYNVYGANIPADMNGQMEALTFYIVGPGDTLLDDIEFVPVPEPSEYALMAAGAGALFTFRRRR